MLFWKYKGIGSWRWFLVKYIQFWIKWVFINIVVFKIVRIIKIIKMKKSNLNWYKNNEEVWLFSKKGPPSKAELELAGLNEGIRIRSEGVNIQSAHVYALPYVIPYRYGQFVSPCSDLSTPLWCNRRKVIPAFDLNSIDWSIWGKGCDVMSLWRPIRWN